MEKEIIVNGENIKIDNTCYSEAYHQDHEEIGFSRLIYKKDVVIIDIYTDNPEIFKNTAKQGIDIRVNNREKIKFLD